MKEITIRRFFVFIALALMCFTNAYSQVVLFSDDFNNATSTTDLNEGLNGFNGRTVSGIYASSTAYVDTSGAETWRTQVSNAGRPGAALIFGAAAGPNRNFNGADSDGGFEVSVDMWPANGASTVSGDWCGIAVGSASSAVYPYESGFGILFKANGNIQAWDGGTQFINDDVQWGSSWNGIDPIQVRIVATGLNDGNPFDGAGQTQVDVYVNETLVVTRVSGNANGYADNYVSLSGNSNNNMFDNLVMTGVASQPDMGNTVLIGPVGSDPVLDFASYELGSYLSQMTSTVFPTSASIDPSRLNIVYGTPASNPVLNQILQDEGIVLTAETPGFDGYYIRTLTYNGAEVVLLAAYEPRPVLYSVYHFLELLGCRFYGKTVAGNEEIVPQIATLVVGDYNVVESPFVKQRVINNNDFFASDSVKLELFADWAAKSRFNTFQLGLREIDETYDPTILQKRGIDIHLATHNWTQFTPGGTFQPQWDDETQFQIFLDNVIAYAQDHPEAVSIGAWQEDSSQGKYRVDVDGDLYRFTELNLYTMNRIAEAFVAADLPHRVLWMAYVEGNVPPDPTVIQPHPRVDLYYFNIVQDYAYPLENYHNSKYPDFHQGRYIEHLFENSDWEPFPLSDQNVSPRSRALQWSNYLDTVNFTGDVIVVDHLNANIGWWINDMKQTFTPLGIWGDGVLEADIEYHNQLGFTGWANTFEYPFWQHTPGPYWWRRAAEAIWNPSPETDLEMDYYNMYYGVDLADRVKAYFDAMWLECLSSPKDAASLARVEGELLTEINSIYAQAQAGTSQDVLNRLGIVRDWHIDRVILHKQIFLDEDRLFGVATFSGSGDATPLSISGSVVADSTGFTMSNDVTAVLDPTVPVRTARGGLDPYLGMSFGRIRADLASAIPFGTNGHLVFECELYDGSGVRQATLVTGLGFNKVQEQVFDGDWGTKLLEQNNFFSGSPVGLYLALYAHNYQILVDTGLGYELLVRRYWSNIAGVTPDENWSARVKIRNWTDTQLKVEKVVWCGMGIPDINSVVDYALWMEEMADPYPGHTETNKTDNPDSDALSNWEEYAFGGNPFVPDTGFAPIFGMGMGGMELLHVQRKDRTDLNYYLETTTNLVSGVWTNDHYSVTGTNTAFNAEFSEVTNQIPTDVDHRFIRLIAE